VEDQTEDRTDRPPRRQGVHAPVGRGRGIRRRARAARPVRVPRTPRARAASSCRLPRLPAARRGPASSASALPAPRAAVSARGSSRPRPARPATGRRPPAVSQGPAPPPTTPARRPARRGRRQGVGPCGPVSGPSGVSGVHAWPPPSDPRSHGGRPPAAVPVLRCDALLPRSVAARRRAPGDVHPKGAMCGSTAVRPSRTRTPQAGSGTAPHRTAPRRAAPITGPDTAAGTNPVSGRQRSRGPRLTRSRPGTSSGTSRGRP
jgi:hypothetical protein